VLLCCLFGLLETADHDGAEDGESDGGPSENHHRDRVDEGLHDTLHVLSGSLGEINLEDLIPRSSWESIRSSSILVLVLLTVMTT
jgi:hypothetical protein